MIKIAKTHNRQIELRSFGFSLRRCFAMLAAMLLLSACANQEEEDTLVKNITDAYEKAQTSMENGNYRRAIQIFEALQGRFPFSDLSKQIHLQLMYAYHKSGQQERAIDAADTFMRENPTHTRIDYALYIKALANFESDRTFLERWFRRNVRGRPPRGAETAFSLFRRLIERYPASSYADDAKQRMIYLKNRLAAYENSVASYYIRSGAYVAAVNRAKTALELYNGADSNIESLKLLLKAYEGLGMNDLADDTRRVIEENSSTDG